MVKPDAGEAGAVTGVSVTPPLLLLSVSVPLLVVIAPSVPLCVTSMYFEPVVVP